MAQLVALIDANVFYGMTTTDIVMELAKNGLFTARWTNLIHDEWTYHLERNRPDIAPPLIARRRRTMDEAVRDPLISGFEPRIAGLMLPDPNDRHVLAAAMHGQCTHIVTFDVSDFPAAVLAPHGIEAIHPDAFLCALLTEDPNQVLACVALILGRMKRTMPTFETYLAKLKRAHLGQFATALATHMGSLS